MTDRLTAEQRTAAQQQSTHDAFWGGIARVRANLTDPLYQEMTANPNKLLPYAVYWPKVTRALQSA